MSSRISLTLYCRFHQFSEFSNISELQAEPGSRHVQFYHYRRLVFVSSSVSEVNDSACFQGVETDARNRAYTVSESAEAPSERSRGVPSVPLCQVFFQYFPGEFLQFHFALIHFLTQGKSCRGPGTVSRLFC